MVDLLAKTACDGLAPLNIGTVCLREGPTVPMTTLAPYRGQQAALDAALQAAHGLGFPPLGGSCQSGDARALWFGRALGLRRGIEPEARHMQASICRIEEDCFQIMVFRSMARTMYHDLKTAMEAWAARG